MFVKLLQIDGCCSGLQIESEDIVLTNTCPSRFGHTYRIKVKKIINSVPSTLTLDANFLKFLYGYRMYPDDRTQHITEADLFPNMCVPSFRSRVVITTRLTHWELSYRCSCHQPYGLYCRCLKTLSLMKWAKDVADFVNDAAAKEPEPKIFVTDLTVHTFFWQDVDPIFDFQNPLTCLFQTLTMEGIECNYAYAKNGDTMFLYITPDYLHFPAHRRLESLAACKRRLPYVLIIECFPFARYSR
ncbi:ORF14 [Aviadenovirus phalacrocoracidae]|uniref:ORF14 n=1 Tax=Aviadenovirus sp. TaxID=2217649 RepID=A0ABZ0T2M4_9ADEN|nr:ORF14 [Aviadenovirus sp.]